MLKKKLLFMAVVLVMFWGCNNSSRQGNGQQNENNKQEQPATPDSMVQRENTSKPEPSAKKLEIPKYMNYQEYHNDRFGFCVSYPSSFLIGEGESANMDGQQFHSLHGRVVMSVSARHAIGSTIKDEFEASSSASDEEGPKKVYTYKTLKNNWFVISGHKGDRIFYEKTYMLNDDFKTIYFEYPASVKEEFTPVMLKIIASFPNCKSNSPT